MRPEDLAGVKMRMPGGESWQFLGKAVGANPVAMDYAEVYTGLQTGAIDAQDNPLPNDKLMKFYEVTDQIILTAHNIGFGLLLIGSSTFDALPAAEQTRMREAARKGFAWSTAEYEKQEKELVGFFREQGLEVYEPDLEAFRAYAQKQYRESPLSASWPAGMLDKINAL
jgi:TRAP-type C4-dicarboxylate transport system substrate-binding protein